MRGRRFLKLLSIAFFAIGSTLALGLAYLAQNKPVRDKAFASLCAVMTGAFRVCLAAVLMSLSVLLVVRIASSTPASQYLAIAEVSIASASQARCPPSFARWCALC
jgi:hypothetical protein